MGKVQSTFINVYPGAISRNVDDVVISLVNTGSDEIAFGAPVFLDATNKGAIGFSNGASMASFLGFATRIGVKTPEVYGSSEAGYNAKDVMSIIVRGSVCVPVDSGDPVIGGKVYMDANGKITATATNNTQLTNCFFRNVYGSNGCAEIVITERNIQ